MRKLSGVEIANIVFMILATVLGATCYFAVRTQSEGKQTLEFVNKAKGAATSKNGDLKKQIDGLKERAGYAATEKADEAVDAMQKDIDGALGVVKANETYVGAIMSLQANLDRKNVEFAEFTAQRDEALNRQEVEEAKSDAQKAEFDAKLADFKQQHDEIVAKATTSLKDLESSYKEQTTALNEVKDKTKAALAQAQQVQADYEESSKKFSDINLDLSKRVDELSNADRALADAEIVFADQQKKVVRLNVGEADGVRPLTTFNIFPYNALDMDTATPKGSVQVVRSLGEHVCEAMILEDEMSNPIKLGDLAYTPLWRAGEVMQYALDYSLDVDGDGRGDLEKLSTVIRSSGAEVQAFITDEGERVNSIGRDCYRLIVADRSIDETLLDDPSFDDATKEKIKRNHDELLKEAEANDVPTMKLSEFLASIGYKETAQITRYQEEGGVSLEENGVARQIVSPGVVAPTYVEDADKAPESPGIVAPVYDKDSDKAPVSPGKVSDYYLRKRADKK